MSEQRVVVVGASAGGVEAVTNLISWLPAGFDAAVCVVVHIPVYRPSVLHRIVQRVTPLRVVQPERNSTLERGVIYTAPADHHLLVAPGEVRVSRGPRENGHRPAIDPLFRSAARAYGDRTTAV